MLRRLESKNLFNFQLNGVIDEDIQISEENEQKLDDNSLDIIDMLTSINDETFLSGIRRKMEDSMIREQQVPEYTAGIQNCIHTKYSFLIWQQNVGLSKSA